MTVNKNKIAILVGAGAVKNAWTPILNIFSPIIGLEAEPDSVNFLLAKSICALRLYSKLPQGAKQLKQELQTVSLLKDGIGNALKFAQKNGVLMPRKEFTNLLDKFVLCDPNNLFGIVTTNWDTVIDEEADRWVKERYHDLETAKVFHIHGSIKAHEHLYLPSETSMENYRSNDENYEVGYAHAATYQFLQQANVIIIYGLSLDPLDAELNLILNGALKQSSTLKEVIIINPEYQKIRIRIKILLWPRTDITIRCFKPKNLEVEV